MQDETRKATIHDNNLSRCPHLGLRDDPDTCFLFPAPANLCYKAQPLGAVKLEHQENYCLNEQYSSCVTYRQPGKVALSEGGVWLQKPEPALGERRLTPLLIVSGVAFIVIVAFLLLNRTAPDATRITGSSEDENPPVETLEAGAGTLRLDLSGATATSTGTASPSPTMTGTPTATSTPSGPPDTATPTETVQACVLPGGWVPYVVGQGETLQGIGLRYGLSAIELQAANCLLTSTVDAGQIIYVPTATPTPTSTPTNPPPPPTETSPPPPPPPTETSPPPPPPGPQPEPTNTPPPPPPPTATPPNP